MPIYEYVCSRCRHEFELMRAIEQRDEPAPCPQCGGQGGRLPSVFGAKTGSYIRPATGGAFRGETVKKE